jgi:uncharacterized protein (TIGR03437 family)
VSAEFPISTLETDDDTSVLIVAMLEGLVKVAPLLIAAEEAPAEQLSIVSAAGYQPTVAPESLAAIYGTGLSSALVGAELGDDGQFPTELNGTSVTVDGRSARIVFVSSDQVNVLVPVETETGAATVVVSNANSDASFTGRVEVGLVAPALFSLDASGSGEGSILNAVTYTPGPFSVRTPEIEGADKATRLALYGTGFRFAGSSSDNRVAGDV